MKYHIRFLIIAMLTGASAWAYAPHPSYLTTKYKDEMLPVVKVLGTDPVVMVDGKEKRLRFEPLYLIRRAPGYSIRSFDIVSQYLSTLETKMVTAAEASGDAVQESQGGRFGKATFDYVFKPRENFSGGYVVVVMYSPSLLKSVQGARPEIVVHDLPDLPAGVATKVSFGSAIPDGRPDRTFFTQIFDAQGTEVLTNRSRDSWLFYSALERNKLKQTIPQYLEKIAGGDHAVTPVVMPRPIVIPGMSLPTAPVTATLTISEEGIVTDVDLPEMNDRNLHRDTAEALGGWLFFPKLDQGRPVATKVMVPIKF